MIETDYLVVGCGTSGLAFADTLLAETDAHITIVDRHGKPGGHWNDAYPFVTLHQPSAFYGVNSMELCGGRIDTAGLNRGLQELASGAEISGYFHRVMNQHLLPSGRVRYQPLSHYAGDDDGHAIESLLSGKRTPVRVRRKIVDAKHYGPTVPSTHTPRFTVDTGARLTTPNTLPDIIGTASGATAPRHFVVLGAGKTAIDTCTWLMESGADADAITWVVPRDPWLLNRAVQQNGEAFFQAAIGGQADQMEAFARATSIDDLFLRLEACGMLLRIDRGRTPTMFHLATVTGPEVELLRRIRHVVRLGRVVALEPGTMRLEGGAVPLKADSVVVDCTASAVDTPPPQPVFQGERIVLQMLRLPQPAFSAALIAYVEAHHADEAKGNLLCRPVPFPRTLQDYPRSMLASMTNQFRWGQDPDLRRWIRESRLDGFGKLVAGADRDDAAKQATIARLKEQSVAAMANLPKLAAGADRSAAPGMPD